MIAQAEVIFSTVHGSHLYGLAHPGSDEDRFVVTTSTRGKACQSTSGNDDVVRVGLTAFLARAAGGSHQSVEALFSPYQQWNPTHLRYRPMLDGLRVCGGAVFAKYERTITAFAFGDFKRRRHAARLTLNLAELRRHGRFTPVLTAAEVTLVNEQAALTGDELLHVLIPGYR